MSQILIICGHPDYKHSVANRAILDELHILVPEADIINLEELYPDSKMNVELEQKRLIEVGTLVFEFPMWWYGAPSLIHSYIEQVFTHGFAYGSKGTALHGKKFIISFTTGAPEEAYSPNGQQGFPISAFMPPFEALAKLTGLDYKGAVISYSMAMVAQQSDKMREEIFVKAKDHAHRLAKMIK